MVVIKKKLIYNFLFMIASISLGLFSGNGYFSLLIVSMVFIQIGLIVEQRSSLHMMFFLGFASFIFLPAILNWFYRDTSFELFFLSAFVSYFFLHWTKGIKVNKFINHGKNVKYLFMSVCLFSIIAILVGQGLWIGRLFSILIILLSLNFTENKFFKNLFYFSIFILVWFTYSVVFWDGYGRTVVMGWLILALLQFFYSINFNVNKYIFSVVPGLLSTLLSSRNILSLSFSGIENVLDDSAYGPYRLASTFTNHYQDNYIDFFGLLEQIIFTFFVFVPRAIWTDKPLGFGYEYTVQNLDEGLIEAGHSIAATLIGEHLYYISYLGVFSSLIVLLIFSKLSKVLYQIKGLNGHGVLILSSSMMVLVWGGMTSFSARIVYALICFIIFFILFKLSSNYQKY